MDKEGDFTFIVDPEVLGAEFLLENPGILKDRFVGLFGNLDVVEDDWALERPQIVVFAPAHRVV